MTDRIMPGDPPWLIAAFRDLGLREVPGPRSSPRICEMYSAAGHPAPEKLDDSKWSWCSAAMNAWFVESGLKGTGSLMGRSWLKRGNKLNSSKRLPRGALLVFKYDDNPSHGHICCLLQDNGDRLRVIGANQGNAVSVMSWPRDKMIGAVWPSDYPMPNVVPLPRSRPRPDTQEGEPDIPTDAPTPPLPRQPDDPGPGPAPLPPAKPGIFRRIGNWFGSIFASGGLFYMDWRLGVLAALAAIALIGFLLWLFGKDKIKTWISRNLGGG